MQPRVSRSFRRSCPPLALGLGLTVAFGLLAPDAQARLRMPFGGMAKKPGGLTVGLLYDTELFKDPLQNGGTIPIVDASATDVTNTSLSLFYQYLDWAAIGLVIPVKDVTAPKGTAPVFFVRHNQGLGDTMLLNRFQVWGSVPGDPFISLGGGFRLPTGNASPDYVWPGATSNSHDPTLNTGSGTVDPMLAGWYNQQFDAFGLLGAVIYRQTGTENAWRFRGSSEFQGTFGATYNVADWAQLSGTVTWIYDDMAQDFGGLQPKPGTNFNSGGNWWWFTPGTNFNINGVNYFTTLDLPMYQGVNGTQLVSNFRFTTGINYKFDLPMLAKPAGPPPAAIGGGLDLLGVASTSVDGFPLVSTNGEDVDLAQAVDPGKIVLFEFTSKTCQTCRAIAPTLSALQSDEPGLLVKQVDIGNGDTPIVSHYGIDATPTFLLFDTRGRVAARFASGDIGDVRAAVERAKAAAANQDLSQPQLQPIPIHDKNAKPPTPVKKTPEFTPIN